MKIFHLIPKGDRWELTEEGGPAIATYDTKQDGLEGSRRVLTTETGSLKILRADGSIEDEETSPGCVPSHTI